MEKALLVELSRTVEDITDKICNIYNSPNNGTADDSKQNLFLDLGIEILALGYKLTGKDGRSLVIHSDRTYYDKYNIDELTELCDNYIKIKRDINSIIDKIKSKYLEKLYVSDGCVCSKYRAEVGREMISLIETIDYMKYLYDKSDLYNSIASLYDDDNRIIKLGRKLTIDIVNGKIYRQDIPISNDDKCNISSKLEDIIIRHHNIIKQIISHLKASIKIVTRDAFDKFDKDLLNDNATIEISNINDTVNIKVVDNALLLYNADIDITL